MTPEKKVQDKVMAYLKLLEERGLPVYSERRQAGGFSYKMGQADLWAVINGKHIEIEIKAPGEQLRPMQVKWAEKCYKMDALYFCVDDVYAFIRNMVKLYGPSYDF